jgi:VWFA-related protein
MALGFRWTAAATVSLCLSVSLSAQEAPRASQEQVFGETIDVRVVNVEAVVTNRGGERVRGLKAGDFKLLVDGKEVPVEYFAEVEEGSAVAASGSGSGGPVTAGEEVGRNYLVFIDEAISIQSQRDDLLKKMKLDLNLLRPADRMAVLAFDGLHIEILANWTQDATVLAAAFDKARQRPAQGLVARVHLEAPQSELNLMADSAATLDDGDRTGGPDPMRRAKPLCGRRASCFSAAQSRRRSSSSSSGNPGGGAGSSRFRSPSACRSTPWRSRPRGWAMRRRSP